MKEAFKHDYSGHYAPNISRQKYATGTFSAGVFQWLPKSNGKGLKKSAVKFRVKGYVSNPDLVYRVAEDFCRMLDNGIEPKTKSVFVKY